VPAPPPTSEVPCHKYHVTSAMSEVTVRPARPNWVPVCRPLAGLLLLAALCLLPTLGEARLNALPQRLYQSGPVPPLSGLVGTGIGDVVWSGRYLWVATERGLAQWDPRRGNGLDPTHWITFTEANGLGHGAVSAMDAVGDTVWVATVFDTTYAGASGSVPVGSGLSWSVDGGATWGHIGNQAIFEGPGFEGGPSTAAQNPAWGLALDGDTVWAVFWAGASVRSRDHGATWERVLPDGAERIVFFAADTAADSLRLVADSLSRAGADAALIAAATAGADSLAHQALLHRTFSVEAYNDTVWIGTAGGIARSFDGGDTWHVNRVRVDAAGQILPGNISGDWVLAIERHIEPDGASSVWAGASLSEGPGQMEGLCHTTDHGRTWRTGASAVGPVFAWDYTFTPGLVWAATGRGVFASADGGATFDSVVVTDPNSGERLRGAFVGAEAIEVGSEAILWVGAENGLARSLDSGATWSILSFPVKTLTLDGDEVIGEGGLVDADSIRTYAAPNPFAPSRDEACRIVYALSRDADVSIDIYDFASRRVRRLLDDQFRPGQENHWYNWDGRDDDGLYVANGVYFYRVELDGGSQAFGKVVVLE